MREILDFRLQTSDFRLEMDQGARIVINSLMSEV